MRRPLVLVLEGFQCQGQTSIDCTGVETPYAPIFFKVVPYLFVYKANESSFPVSRCIFFESG